MLTLQPCFHFRWLTRRHLHVSAKKVADSAKPVEPSSDSSKKPTKKPTKKSTKKSKKTDSDGLDDPLPAKRGRKRKVTGPSLLVESKVRDFLNHVESTKHTLGLEDLERYRPDRQPTPTSPEFEEQYNLLCNTLSRAFNKEQLRVFLKSYGLDLYLASPKKAYITKILEDAWKWPSLEKIKKEKKIGRAHV